MRRLPRPDNRSVADLVLDTPDETILDVLDHVLSKGVMATGDVTLGVAGVELIYLRLSALLCAADRVLPASKQPRLSSGRRRQQREKRRR
jgi:hypothetical protein